MYRPESDRARFAEIRGIDMRLHIIGGPGSGKSFLARQLGVQLGIPVYELDKIAFEGLYFTDRSMEARLADIRKIAAEPQWVTEGMFLGWTDDLLQAADTIIWLDHLGWCTAYWRIVIRFMRWGVEEAKRQHGLRKFTRFRDYARNLRLLAGVFFSSRRYYCDTRSTGTSDNTVESRSATARHLAPYLDKTVHCRNYCEIESFVSTLLNNLAKG